MPQNIRRRCTQWSAPTLPSSVAKSCCCGRHPTHLLCESRHRRLLLIKPLIAYCIQLPRVLLDEQKEVLQQQAQEAKELVEREADEFATYQARTEEELRELKIKLQEAQSKLDELRGGSGRDGLQSQGQDRMDEDDKQADVRAGARVSDIDMQVDAEGVQT